MKIHWNERGKTLGELLNVAAVIAGVWLGLWAIVPGCPG